MPSVYDWSTTPASNTTISGINIAEGCPSGNMNDAVRTLMATTRSTFDANLQNFLVNATTTPLALTYGGTGSGTAAGARTNLGAAASGANTDITSLNPTVGLQIGAPTGGAQGANTLNVQTLYLNGTLFTASAYAPLAGATYTGKVTTVASAVGAAGFNLPSGVAPTTPTAGDMWNASGLLLFYTGSVTRQLATLDGTETFSNKTLTSPTINTPTLKNPASTAQTLTDAATITWDANAGEVASVTLGGNRTLALPTNLKAGTYLLKVTQDATGSRTLAYAAGYKWPSGSAPTLTTTANAIDILTFFSDGTSMFGAAQKAFA